MLWGKFNANLGYSKVFPLNVIFVHPVIIGALVWGCWCICAEHVLTKWNCWVDSGTFHSMCEGPFLCASSSQVLLSALPFTESGVVGEGVGVGEGAHRTTGVGAAPRVYQLGGRCEGCAWAGEGVPVRTESQTVVKFLVLLPSHWSDSSALWHPLSFSWDPFPTRFNVAIERLLLCLLPFQCLVPKTLLTKAMKSLPEHRSSEGFEVFPQGRKSSTSLQKTQDSLGVKWRIQ